MTGAEQSALGQQIDNRNPYSFLQQTPPLPPPPPPSGMRLQLNALPAGATPNWILEIEEDSYVDSTWQFRGRALRIAKAIRIPYNYLDEWGNLVREYLVIGYEGSTGD